MTCPKDCFTNFVLSLEPFAIAKTEDDPIRLSVLTPVSRFSTLIIMQSEKRLCIYEINISTDGNVFVIPEFSAGLRLRNLRFRLKSPQWKLRFIKKRKFTENSIFVDILTMRFCDIVDRIAFTLLKLYKKKTLNKCLLIKFFRNLTKQSSIHQLLS